MMGLPPGPGRDHGEVLMAVANLGMPRDGDDLAARAASGAIRITGKAM